MKLASKLMATTIMAVALGSTAALAEPNPIVARKALMKEIGDQAKVGAAMAKGEAPFDLAKAKQIFATIERNTEKMPDLFPENSKTGHDTTASPKIWENEGHFTALFTKVNSEAQTARLTVTDFDSFKAAFADMGKNCGACHNEYRIKKN